MARLRELSGLVLVFAIGSGLFLAADGDAQQRDYLVIGSRTSTDPLLLNYMAMFLIQQETPYKVEFRRIQSNFILHQALNSGDVDLGIGWAGGVMGLLVPELKGEVDLNDRRLYDDDYVWRYVKEKHEQKLNRTWLKPFGYDDSFAVSVRRDFAQKHNLKKVSDLARIDTSQLTIALENTFKDRPVGAQGYTDLLGFYGIRKFKREVTMDINLTYQALRDGQVDVAVLYSSDPRIMTYDLAWLEDDKHLWRPFDPAFMIRLPALKQFPNIDKVLLKLNDKITNEKMYKLRAKVDLDREDPAKVARQFLQDEGLLPK
jgi:glycine betaine/choline ABC-type transport system substrate-binding protein